MSGKVIETSEKVLREAFALYVKDNPDFGAAFRKCESPIEQLFLMSISRMQYENDRVALWCMASVDASERDSYGVDEILDEDIIASFEGGSWLILQQPEIDLGVVKYRVDFAVCVVHDFNAEDGPASGRVLTTKLAIELDGHEWHERTKEQAKADRERDRRLQAGGWNVIRFTGSEVYEDASACLRESIEVALGIDSTFAQVVHDSCDDPSAEGEAVTLPPQETTSANAEEAA